MKKIGMHHNSFLFNVTTFSILFFGFISSNAQDVSKLVKVNQIGYLNDKSKVAYVSSENALTLSSWSLRNSSNDEVVKESSVFSPGLDDESTGELVYTIDFSDYDTAGNYYVQVEGIGRSYDFEISTTVYNDVFDLIMKGFYFQRSGIDLKEEYAGQWAKPAEYAEDAFVYEGFDGQNVIKGEKIDVVGGWRDAGDPNKKVVPASISIYQLLVLYERFPTFISNSEVNIPQDENLLELPDFLLEVKYALDWLVKMQRQDGAVWHAVAQENFYLDDTGDKDPNPRFLLPVSTTATADFAAVTATAYRVFKAFDSTYANALLSASEKAWSALGESSIWSNPHLPGEDGSLQYPEENGYSGDPPGINNTGVYEDLYDADERHWASAELAISTNKEEYHNYFKSGIDNGIWYPSLWPAVANLGNFSYALAFKDEGSSTVNLLKGYIESYMDIYLQRLLSTGFGTCLSPSDYYWGSNNLVGQFAYTFLLSHLILDDERYEDAALSLLNYILGANSLNQTFITGIGSKPVKNIFHLPSWLDDEEESVPGLIPGGPNQFLVETDIVHANLISLESPPPAKCYVDSEFSFASNEAVILESAAWAFVTGYFYYQVIDQDNDGYNIEDDCDDLNAMVNQGREEVPYNGLDDDCNSETLDDDLDQDGFILANDCDDLNAAINPDANEVPNNGIDENCDGADLSSSISSEIEDKIFLYPNPVRETIQIISDQEFSSYSIYNMDGKRVLFEAYNGGSINVENLSSGLYFISLTSDYLTFNASFVKL